MSQIEQTAKPVLTSLIQGKSLLLDQSKLQAIATWAALRSIMMDSIDPNLTAVPASDHAWMFDHREPPPTWAIWLGRHRGLMWFRNWKHNSFALFTGPGIFVPPTKSNTQTTTIGLGQLFLHVLSAPDSPIIARYRTALDHLPRIWPLPKQALYWPLPSIATDREVQTVADLMHRFDTRVRYPPNQ